MLKYQHYGYIRWFETIFFSNESTTIFVVVVADATLVETVALLVLLVAM